MTPSGDSKHPIQRISLIAFFLGCFFLLFLWHGSSPSHDQPTVDKLLKRDEQQKMKAVVVLTGTTGVTGTLTFAQDGANYPTRINGTITGLDANSKRGLHIHAYGDLTNGCNSTLTHYNPFNKTHGGPTDEVRHVGDLGNVDVDANKVANLDITISGIELSGPYSVVGRGMVVHAGTDDLGKVDNDGSRTTGNAGARAACGVIGFAPLT